MTHRESDQRQNRFIPASAVTSEGSQCGGFDDDDCVAVAPAVELCVPRQGVVASALPSRHGSNGSGSGDGQQLWKPMFALDVQTSRHLSTGNSSVSGRGSGAVNGGSGGGGGDVCYYTAEEVARIQSPLYSSASCPTKYCFWCVCYLYVLSCRQF